jgi:hypothetical protein
LTPATFSSDAMARGTRWLASFKAGVQPTHSNWLTWQTTHWQDWLDQQTKQRREVFLIDPDEMMSAAIRESSRETPTFCKQPCVNSLSTSTLARTLA